MEIDGLETRAVCVPCVVCVVCACTTLQHGENMMLCVVQDKYVRICLHQRRDEKAETGRTAAERVLVRGGPSLPFTADSSALNCGFRQPDNRRAGRPESGADG